MVEYLSLQQGPFGLLLRHGERYPIIKGAAGDEALLTEKGFKDSYLLGQALQGKGPFSLISSPVERCCQTASEVQKGLKQKKGPEKRDYLASGYIKDWKKLQADLPGGGFEEIMINFIENEKYPGLRDLESGSLYLMDLLEKETANRPFLAFSHDAVIMPLLQYGNPGWYQENGWLPYLSGALLLFRPGKIIPLFFQDILELESDKQDC